MEGRRHYQLAIHTSSGWPRREGEYYRLGDPDYGVKNTSPLGGIQPWTSTGKISPLSDLRISGVYWRTVGNWDCTCIDLLAPSPSTEIAIEISLMFWSTFQKHFSETSSPHQDPPPVPFALTLIPHSGESAIVIMCICIGEKVKPAQRCSSKSSRTDSTSDQGGGCHHNR